MLKHCYNDVQKIQYKGWGQVKHKAKPSVVHDTRPHPEYYIFLYILSKIYCFA